LQRAARDSGINQAKRVIDRCLRRLSKKDDEGKIEVTVDNQNIMPITTCTVECDFTILFIESGYSTSTEYGRGSKTIEVGDIGGKSEKTETIDFNPDDYYDSYGSYIMATLFEKNVELISIE